MSRRACLPERIGAVANRNGHDAKISANVSFRRSATTAQGTERTRQVRGGWWSIASNQRGWRPIMGGLWSLRNRIDRVLSITVPNKKCAAKSNGQFPE